MSGMCARSERIKHCGTMGEMGAGGHLHERAIDAHRGAHGKGCVEEAARRVRGAHQAKHRGCALPHAPTDACTIACENARAHTCARTPARKTHMWQQRRHIWTRLDSPTRSRWADGCRVDCNMTRGMQRGAWHRGNAITDRALRQTTRHEAMRHDETASAHRRTPDESDAVRIAAKGADVRLHPPGGTSRSTQTFVSTREYPNAP